MPLLAESHSKLSEKLADLGIILQKKKNNLVIFLHIIVTHEICYKYFYSYIFFSNAKSSVRIDHLANLISFLLSLCGFGQLDVFLYRLWNLD